MNYFRKRSSPRRFFGDWDESKVKRDKGEFAPQEGSKNGEGEDRSDPSEAVPEDWDMDEVGLGGEITSADDEAYKRAVDGGDLDQAQAIVRSAILNTIPENVLTHGGKPAEGHAIEFAEGLESNEQYWPTGSPYLYTVSEDQLASADDERFVDFAMEYYGSDDREKMEEEVNPDRLVDTAGVWDDHQFVSDFYERFGDEFRAAGKNGIRTYDGAVAFPDTEMNQIGAAVVKGEDGTTVPLSRRLPWIKGAK